MKRWRYTRLFPGASQRPRQSELNDLFDVLAAIPGSMGDLPAGHTYLGQFVVHDVTSQKGPQHLKSDGTIRRVNLNQLTSVNKPALDLDSVYRRGRSDSVIPFDETGAFRLGSAGSKKDSDLPRDEGFGPLIGDSRNDDNLLIAQIQVLFMRFHNRIIEDLLATGVADPASLFRRAKREVTKVYQYLVLHDLLRRLVPETVFEEIVLEGHGQLSTPSKTDPTMPLEFADAACRLHSLVRVSYTLRDGRSINLFNADGTGRLTGKDQLAEPGQSLLQEDDVVDWRHFFEFSNYPEQRKPWQHANAFSFVVNPFLRKLAGSIPQVDLLKNNVLREISHGVCTGQEACRTLRQRFPELSAAFGLRCIDGSDFVLGQLGATNSLRAKTPLWLYLMLEAAPGRLGALGGWIVADVLRTAALNSDICLSKLSDVEGGELYEPLKDAAGERDITIEDVIMYTYKYQPNS